MMFGKNPGTDATWKRIPEGSTGAELGVWMGDSSAPMLPSGMRFHVASVPGFLPNIIVLLPF